MAVVAVAEIVLRKAFCASTEAALEAPAETRFPADLIALVAVAEDRATAFVMARRNEVALLAEAETIFPAERAIVVAVEDVTVIVFRKVRSAITVVELAALAAMILAALLMKEVADAAEAATILPVERARAVALVAVTEIAFATVLGARIVTALAEAAEILFPIERRKDVAVADERATFLPICRAKVVLVADAAEIVLRKVRNADTVVELAEEAEIAFAALFINDVAEDAEADTILPIERDIEVAVAEVAEITLGICLATEEDVAEATDRARAIARRSVVAVLDEAAIFFPTERNKLVAEVDDADTAFAADFINEVVVVETAETVFVNAVLPDDGAEATGFDATGPDPNI